MINGGNEERQGGAGETIFLVEVVVLCRTNFASWLSRKKKESVETPSCSFPFPFRQQHNSKKANKKQGSDHLHTNFANGPGILSSFAQLSLLSITFAFLVCLSLVLSKKKQKQKKG